MATTSEASRLQRLGHVMRFTLITVGLLALVGLSGCGVGVDDVEGQQAAAAQAGSASAQQHDAALVGLEGTPVTDGEQGPASGPVDPGISSLPTDPVPWRNPGDSSRIDPSVDVDPMTGLPIVVPGMPPVTR